MKEQNPQVDSHHFNHKKQLETVSIVPIVPDISRTDTTRPQEIPDFLTTDSSALRHMGKRDRNPGRKRGQPEKSKKEEKKPNRVWCPHCGAFHYKNQHSR